MVFLASNTKQNIKDIKMGKKLILNTKNINIKWNYKQVLFILTVKIFLNNEDHDLFTKVQRKNLDLNLIFGHIVGIPYGI